MSENRKDMIPETEEDIIVTLYLDDDAEMDCSIITILEVSGKDYIALRPIVDEDHEYFGDVWFYEYFEDENNPDAEPELNCIEDDDIYEAVVDAFDEYLDDQEYDEILPDEDDE